jgi:hypothetical protein
MKYLQKLRLIFTFYRNFIWVSVFINLACGFFLWKNGMGAYSALFWLKLFSLGVSIYFTNEYKKEEYFYFYNFGLSKKILWITTIILDIFLFFALMILSYKLSVL